VFAVHEFLLCKIDTIGFRGCGRRRGHDRGRQRQRRAVRWCRDDTIYAGAGDDLVFGDQGRIECKNDHPFDPETSLRPICWEDFPLQGFLLFEAINVDQSPVPATTWSTVRTAATC
jgi:hypothetical protein